MNQSAMAHQNHTASGSDHSAWIPATADCYQTLQTITLDLWRISLEQPPPLELLSKDEITRMNRYRFADDRRRFAVARSGLRQILGRYAQQSPATLVFNYGSYGKPYLSNTPSLEFNLSHSGEYALCGVSRESVGVDIEQLRPMDRLDGLVKRCLAPSEQQAMAKASPLLRSQTFLEYWTCKEAYLKATGQGISEALAAIEVDLDPSPRLNVPGQPWQLKVFTPCLGYTAAAVVSPKITQTRHWDYGKNLN
ncbi:MAG: 4'-phosphopantetheinyl transferase superfamily protein [Symploca sp. SIO2G7]|nr:4'-phosphopantetheinyl transferase superfamily protein [Symploca sp. SIO2G7]